MLKFKLQRRSIAYQLTRLILGVIVLQTLLFSAILVLGGVIEQAEDNTYQLFHDKVNSRKDYVLSEMKNNWTNFEPYLANMANISATAGNDSDLFFKEVMPELISMLRTTQATGVFIILKPEQGNDSAMPALYLRDYDPQMNSYSNDDIYMVYGSPELAKSLMIPLDQTWELNFHTSNSNSTFIEKPYNNATVASQAMLLGYWSTPFKLSRNDASIITYSLPFYDRSGKLRGVIGVEITLNYLARLLPAAELQIQDSLGYLVAFRAGNEGKLMPIIMGGAMQRRMIDPDQPLALVPVNNTHEIYKILDHKGKEDLYAVIKKIGLYQFNTPFQNEQWYLVGIMRGDYLLRYTHRIIQILWLSLMAAIFIGAVGGMLISYRFSWPIVSLAEQVKRSNLERELQFSPTGLQELDELSASVKQANHMMVESASKLTKIVDLLELPIGAFEINHKLGRIFVTDSFWAIIHVDKNTIASLQSYSAFLIIAKELMRNPESEETDTYLISEAPKRWIRYKRLETSETTTGIVMDVTDEIIEKKKIMRERDFDPLTSLFNHKCFQREFYKWREQAPDDKLSALIMFDLDNLKMINDSYGHKWGDQYIIMAADMLREVAPKDQSLLARRSGDEFVLLLHAYDSPDKIRQCLETFYRRLPNQPILCPDGRAIPITISAGLMWITAESLSYDALLHFADEALYVAKRTNKGYFVENNNPA